MTDHLLIRRLIAEWLDATTARDLARLLPLMADDVVFLSAGQPPMVGRDAFAGSFEAGRKAHRLSGTVAVEEVVVSGDVAYARSYLTVTATPVGGGPSVRLSGHSLSVLRREAGGWVIARDANLLVPSP
ncbi:MAG: YybH family protein [Gemmataceae bacterium]